MNLTAIQIKPITNQQEFEETCVLIDALVDADLMADPNDRKKALSIYAPSHHHPTTSRALIVEGETPKSRLIWMCGKWQRRPILIIAK